MQSPGEVQLGIVLTLSLAATSALAQARRAALAQCVAQNLLYGPKLGAPATAVQRRPNVRSALGSGPELLAVSVPMQAPVKALSHRPLSPRPLLGE